jgi:hypothetical protein
MCAGDESSVECCSQPGVQCCPAGEQFNPTTQRCTRNTGCGPCPAGFLCDPTTGQCATQPLDLAGGQCVCRTMLDGTCDAEDALPAGLRRILLQRLARACDLLDGMSPEMPKKKSAALKRLVRRLTHRVTVTAADRIREPCRTSLSARLQEVLELVNTLHPAKGKGGRR